MSIDISHLCFEGVCEKEVKKSIETISYAAHEIGDGVNCLIEQNPFRLFCLLGFSI